MEPCIKEKEIDTLFDMQRSTHDVLIELKTLVESLIKYQLNESKAKLEDHEKRLFKVEGLVAKIIAWSAVGGVIGGFIANIVADRVRL